MADKLNFLFTQKFRRAVERKTTLLLLNSSALALAACGSGSSGAKDKKFTYPLDNNSLNMVQGSNEDESLLGSSEADYVEGMDGLDFILSLEGDDEIYGGSGDDTIWAGDGNDIIYGGPGNDTIYPGNGNDESYGGDGDDIIFMSSGNDKEDGGDGNDTLKIDGNHAGTATTIDLLLGQYYYTAQGSSAFFNLFSIENLESLSTADLTVLDTPSVNIITTAAGNDLVKSIGGNDIINTGGGNDRVELASGFTYLVNTGPGNDEIVLGLTYSFLDGGSGEDTLIVKPLSGVSTFHADILQGYYFFQGLSTSQDGFDKLLLNIEKILVEGSLNAVLIGGNSSDTFMTDSGSDNLSGGSGNDVIDAGAGDDILDGGAGSDTLTGGMGSDTFKHNLATDGSDTIMDFTVGEDDFILTTTGLVDKAGTAVAANAISADSFVSIDGTAAGSAALAAGNVIIELDQASLGVSIDFSASTVAQIVTAVEELFAGANWDTDNAAAAYIESAIGEDLLFIVYEAAEQGATSDAVLVRATGDGAADSFDGEFTVEAVLTSVAADTLTSAEFIA